MNHHFYGASHATLPRRATVPAPASLAPTASMIDPALESHTFQYATPHFTHGNGNRLHNQSHATIMNGFQQPLQQHHQHQQHQQQSRSAQSTPQSLSKPLTERCLPSKEVNEANFDSAYVQFILYCNPSIPLDVETEELRKGFRNPPRSDGNSFSPWNLFHLLQRMERKEIKTWAHLVTELGVEPPDKEKNQSTQKVQQYAVRLKVCIPILVIISSLRHNLKPHVSLYVVSSAGCTHIMWMRFSTTLHLNQAHTTSSDHLQMLS